MILGIDIGGTKVALALATDAGQIVARERISTDASGNPRADVARMIRALEALLERSGLTAAEISGLGVSAPGPIDRSTGSLIRPPNLPGWGRVPIVAWLAEVFDCRIRLENDANAAALAEWRFGAGRGMRDVVYLTMSTGVGGGLILDGRLHAGRDGTAGEVGHVPVEWEGEACGCGLRGCLEAYVGGRQWAERLRREAPAGSRVLALAGDRARLSPEHVVEAAREGDAHALSELARFNHYLARGIVQIAFTLAPEAVLLGTIASAAGEALCLEPVRRLVREHIWAHQATHMQILAAGLGAELPYLAGVCVALQLESERSESASG